MRKCFSVMAGLYLGTAELFGVPNAPLGMQSNPRNTHNRALFDKNTQYSEFQPTGKSTLFDILQKKSKEFSSNLQSNPRNIHNRALSDKNTQYSEFQSKREKTLSDISPKKSKEFSSNPRNGTGIPEQQKKETNDITDDIILEQQREKIIADAPEHRNHIEKLLNRSSKNKKRPFALNDTGSGSRYTAHYVYYKNETFKKVTITEKHGIVTITGWFYNDYLDLNKKVEIIVANEDQPYTFAIINNSQNIKSQILLPASFITQISEVVPCDKFVCLKFDEGNEGLVVNSEYFYIGDLDNDQITGKGTMVKKTGNILRGIFDHGVLMEENDRIHKNFLEIFPTYKEVADVKD